MRRFVSSPLFLVAAACFFLPFITVACAFNFGEQFEDLGLPGGIPEECTKTTVTGFQLVTADSPDIPQECLQEFDQPIPDIQQPDQDQPGRAWALTAFAAAVGGIGLSLLRRPAGAIASVALGVLGAVALVILRASAAPDIPREVGAFIEVRTEYGFWLSLAFFALATAWGVYRLVSEGVRAAPPSGDAGFGAPSPPPPVAPPPPGPPEEPPAG
ncbi:MAG: hypothetical protein ACRDI0_07015 [Actinomycetota bacterium]